MGFSGFSGLAVRVGLVAIVVVACGAGSKLPPPNVVAKIGDREIKYRSFERYLEHNLGERGGALASAALSELFDQFLDQELLAMLARERGLGAGAGPGRGGATATPSEEAVGELLAATPAPEPTEAELDAAYLRDRAKLARPERVHLRQLLVDDRAAAERARRELAAGAPFDEVAAGLAAGGARDAAPVGTDQGELAKDELPPAFADRIFALPDGGVSDVLAAGYGFHVFQVVRHLPAAAPTREEAAPELRERLRREAADAALRALSAEARSRYTVVVHDRNLPFTYQGAFPTSRPNAHR